MSNFLLPSLEVRHLLPHNFTNEMAEDFLPEQEYITDSVWLKKIPAATVTVDAVVYQHGVLFTANIPKNASRTYYRLRHPLKQWLWSKKVSLTNRAYLLATDIWSSSHFHWLCDVLPRLFCARNQIRDKCLLLQDTPYLRRVAEESFKILGINFQDVIWMQPGYRYHTKELYWITPIATSGHLHPGLMQEMRRYFLRDSLSGKRRIYLSRSGATYRKVLNESELVPVLKQFGFEILHSEEFSFHDQVRLFAETEWLMGVHGAGLANACFMPSGGVVEFRRHERGPRNVGYWHLADAMGLSYYYINGVADSGSSIVGRGCNIYLPQSDLKKFLSNLF